MKRKPKAVTVEERISALLSERARLHRESPSLPIRDAAEAARFISERWIVVSVGRSSLAVLANAIAGRQLTGSWMAHPEVNVIYNIFTELQRFDLCDVRLVSGKWAIIDPLLGPAVTRIAIDEERRAIIIGGLPHSAQQLLERVEAEGSVRMDSLGMPTKEARDARVLLERNLLVAGEELHTERGSHTVLLRPWGTTKLAERFTDEAANLRLVAAEETLVEACLHSAVLAPEREAFRWFDFARGRIKALIEEGRIHRLESQQAWLTLAEV